MCHLKFGGMHNLVKECNFSNKCLKNQEVLEARAGWSYSEKDKQISDGGYHMFKYQ